MDRCTRCGALGETKQVTVLRSIGMLIAVSYRSVGGQWCRPCIDAELGPATLVTATLGWWSIIGLFLTPVFLALNLATFLRTRGMQLPTGAPTSSSAPAVGALGGSPTGPVSTPHTDTGNGGAIAFGIGGALVAALGLLAVAFFGYLWAFGTSPDDARFSPICLGASFVACVLPGIGAAGYGAVRAMRRAG